MTHLDDAALDAIEAREAEAWPERDDCNDDKDRLRASVNDVRPLLAAVREARAAELGWMRDHGRRIEWLIKLLDLDPDDDQGCVPGCTEGPAGLDHMIWHLAEQRDEARAAATDAEQRAQAAQEALERVRELHRRNVYGELDYCATCLHTEGVSWPCDTIRALGDDQQEAT